MLAQPAATTGCSVPLASPSASGSLAVDGGPLGPSAVGGVALRVDYTVIATVYYEPSGSRVSSMCAVWPVNTTTSADGAFSAPLSTPAPLCFSNGPGPYYCVAYSAPYGPVTVAPAAAPPDGYAFSSRPSFTGVGLTPTFVAELAYLGLTPPGTTLTISANAPTTISAAGFMANGSATNLSPTFRWALSGAGWSFVGNATGPSVTVEGASGAALGQLTASASAAAGTVVLRPPPVSVGLVAVRTAVATAGLDRTTLDTGVAEDLSVSGTGAGGYTYTATVAPGLGLSPIVVPCAAAAAPGGLSDISCAASFAYPVAGLAQPTVTLSNGYSAGTWAFPEVTVAPAPELLVTSSVRVGYAAEPLALALAVANGTGSAPYAEACLAPGFGAPLCDVGPGPAWSFAPTYPVPGNYAATGWAIDAAGANGSVSVPVTVVAPPSLTALRLAAANMTAGVPVGLFASYSGGSLPARLYWNVSGSAAPWATATVDADGNVSVVYLPSAAGVVGITLTVVDGLGTVVRSSALFSVGPVPAVRVAPSSGPAPGAAVDGTPLSVAWVALDPYGNPVPTFGGTAVLVVRDGSLEPRAYLNVSRLGPLPSLGNDTYFVPAFAWIGGVLNVTVVPLSNGTFTLELLGAALPNPVAPLSFVASPDTRNVRLYAPVYTSERDRSNATFWHVEDRFGNAVPGAVLTVLEQFGSESTASVVATSALAGGSSGVWVNFTAPGPGAGTVEVLDGAGVVVLGPVGVPAAPAPSATAPTVVAAVAAVPLGAAAVGVSAFVRRHRRRGRRDRSAEEELRSLAEGREKVVALLRRGPRSLGELEAAWEPPPAPPGLADWLASLVADGTLGAAFGPDRVARFRIADGPGRLRVELDPGALEEALRRRAQDAEDGSEAEA